VSYLTGGDLEKSTAFFQTLEARATELKGDQKNKVGRGWLNYLASVHHMFADKQLEYLLSGVANVTFGLSKANKSFKLAIPYEASKAKETG
jgi:hypothetical protein